MHLLPPPNVGPTDGLEYPGGYWDCWTHEHSWLCDLSEWFHEQADNLEETNEQIEQFYEDWGRSRPARDQFIGEAEEGLFESLGDIVGLGCD